MILLDRYSAKSARDLVHRYYGDENAEAVCKHYFSIAVAHADSIEPDSWSLTMTNAYIALDAGRLFVFGLFPGKVSLAFDALGLSASRRNVLEMWGKIREFDNDSVPELLIVDVHPDDLEAAWPDLEALFFSAVDKAAVTASSSAYSKVHSHGFVQMLQQDTGLKVFDPAGRTRGR